MLIKILICFFILLITYQIFLAYSHNFVEGMDNEYKDYHDDAMILAQQNAGNIKVLRGELDGLLGLDKKVQDLSANYANLQDQVNQIMEQQKNYSEKMLPSETPEITGAV